MNRTQIGMALVLKELDISPQDADFRLKKNSLYLAKAACVEVSNHFFMWHYSGRIASEGLSEDFREIETSSEYDESAGWQLDDESKRKLANLKPLLKTAPDLELLTSLHFLLSRKHKEKDLQEILGRYKRPYAVEQIREALAQLSNYSLLSKSS